MYQYNDFDTAFVKNRVAQFRAQVERRIAGTLTEDEFRPLRTMNGLYLQLHAYMLRVAIPYGSLDPAKLRQLAYIAERWDKGYGHFTTRTNIQFHWPRLSDVPDMLEALSEVGMHAIQTSGNTVRNVTSDHFAGAAEGEIEDPRPIAELIRQWSTDHPEFQFLPRKFKIAVIASEADRAVMKSHDIGLRIVEQDGARGFQVWIGGGMGRTPMVARLLRDFLPRADLLPYLEAVLATYNRLGRRDNKFKARVKITVHENGLDEIRRQVEAEFPRRRAVFSGVDQDWLARIEAAFITPSLSPRDTAAYHAARDADPVFRSWCDTNVAPHRRADHGIVTISLKAHGQTPGDMSAEQMRLVADLAERYGHDDIRVSHAQNLVLPHVALTDLPALHAALKPAGLATGNIGLASDLIACPGMDYCALATARSIPVATGIAKRLQELKIEHDVGHLQIKISGCINACGHHHVGHIGILGLDRGGVETYQITLGGDASESTEIGTRTGPGFGYDEIVPAIERLIFAYLDLREAPKETFLETYRRVGMTPFKSALYDEAAAYAAE
ncbi:nitrite/sulfite reductase [Roseovarius amoyensis]|uniref:nitrite/sulfite reductase n=1 Tax=Roseovarius amoyensis TaxID=2211448 RepID=UPI000DBE7ADF|nr:nitrite/sulfite reductase [Roseovarius amoyensis]